MKVTTPRYGGADKLTHEIGTPFMSGTPKCQTFVIPRKFVHMREPGWSGVAFLPSDVCFKL